MAQGGWTGKVLRVDLSNVQIGLEVDTTKQLTAFDVPYKGISKVDTMKYKDYIGGLGLGLKVLWDETTATTRAFDPENRLIFGVGPLRDGTASDGRLSPCYLNDSLAASVYGALWPESNMPAGTPSSWASFRPADGRS
jgi:aldehyde:ferredoxin oxidoreductase